MKKTVLLTIITVMLLSVSAMAVGVNIDFTPVSFNESTGYPFIDGNGRTLVPLRAAMEAFGASVVWDNEQHAAIITKGLQTVVCVQDENCIYLGGTKIDNDSATIIQNGRLYLPIRVVLEAFGAEVSWNGDVNVVSGGVGGLINEIENSTITVSNLWKSWEDALSVKNSGDYAKATELFKQLAPKFIRENDNDSRAILFKHLGECYLSMGKSGEASACFKREAYYWQCAQKVQENIDANRRSMLSESAAVLYAKTNNSEYAPKNVKGGRNGILIGAYAEGDRAVHDPSSMDKFYMNEFPKLVEKDMAAYLIYLTEGKPLSTYKSHIEVAKQKNKIVQVALEPKNLYNLQPGDSYYIQLAKDMESSGCKFYLRFASEMNEPSCPWYTENAALYIEKFRIAADIFHQYAPSVTVVWSPNFYPSENIAQYYPGDNYVDAVGVSSYSVAAPSTDPLGQGIDRSRWSTQLDYIYSLYGYKKPIIVSECGASVINPENGNNEYEFAAKQIEDYFTYLPIRYPNLSAVFIWDSNHNMHRCSLSENPLSLDAFKKSIQGSMYLSDSKQSAGEVYYELGTNANVEGKSVEISSFIKTTKNDIAYAVYRINGADIATSYSAPYSCTIDFSPYRNTRVKLELVAFDSNGALAASESMLVNVK